MFFRTVCFDEVVFIMTDCFFIAFELLRKFYQRKICKDSENHVRKYYSLSGVYDGKTFRALRRY